MDEASFIEQNTEAEEGNNEIVETPEAEELPQLSATEQKAFDQGWRPEEEFDGPTENWKTAKEYVKDGEWISKVNELNRKFDSQKAEFDERLENTNKLNEARRQQEINDLKQEQRAAVDSADTEAFDSAQKKIENLESQPEKPAAKPAQDPSIASWEEKNPWINEIGNEKAAIAQSVWQNYQTQNPTATVSQALAHVDERIGKLFPSAENPRRQQPDTNETPARRSKGKGKGLSMGDLTQAEQSEWAMFGKTMFKTEDKFLKAVADARKGK
jgi:hypothetical protein